MRATSTSVPLAEAKNKLSELVERVRGGEEFVITRHDAEVARLVPAGRTSRRDLHAAIDQLRATRSGRTASPVELRTWKQAGRP